MSRAFGSNNANSGNHYIIVGTTPASGAGGISVALRGLLAGFDSKSLSHVFITTHDPNARFRQIVPFLKALPLFLRSIVRGRRSAERVYIFAHPGPAISLFRKYLLLILGRILGCKTISQVHSLSTDVYLNAPIKRFFMRRYYAAVDHILVLTPWWESRLLSHGIGKGKIKVVPNAIEPNLVRQLMNGTSCNFRKLDGSITIFTMTRFVDGKGIDVVVRALKLLPEHFKLILAGDGPNRRIYEQLAVNEGVEGRVTFTGWVGESEKTILFSQADVFCLPSQQDSFGMVFVEAMAHGVPVVALGCGPIPDVVPDGVVGRIVRQATPQEIAGALAGLAADPHWSDKSSACRAWVKTRYLPEIVLGNLLEALESS